LSRAVPRQNTQGFRELQPISASGGYNARQAEAAVASMPALSIEVVKQSQDTKGFSCCRGAGWAVMLRGALTSMVTGKGIGEAWWRASGGFLYQIYSHGHRQARLG